MNRYFSTFSLIVLMAISGVFLTQAQNGKNGIPKKGPSNEMGLRSSPEKLNKLNETKNQNTLKPFATQILKFNNVVGLIDTLSIRKWQGGDWTNGGDGFGHSAQDVMVQWYKAPADLLVKAVGVGNALNENDQPASIKLVKIINYTSQDLSDLANTNQLGWYPGDGDGFNNLAPFVDDATGSSTGPWVPVDDHPVPWEDLWSEFGIGAPIVPTAHPHDDNLYDWVEMSLLKFEPTVLRGEVFGIVVSNIGDSPNTPDIVGDRQSFWAQAGATSQMYPLLKFYEYTRTTADDGFGWWVRPLALDFVAIVDIFGDEPPQFSDITAVSTTLSTDPQTVEATITDRNPGGGPFGVESATLNYSIDDGATWNGVPMSTSGGDLYTGDIPGQSAGTAIQYFIEAVDVESNANQSAIQSYRIYAPTPGVNTLLVFNGWAHPSGIGFTYPQDFYFGLDILLGNSSFSHDTWSFGPLQTSLVNSYTNILEFCTNGPSDYNDDVIRAWLKGDVSRNYYLQGQEWLGVRYGFADMDFAAGSFEFDILGINQSYNDVSFVSATPTGHLIPSLVMPVAGTTFGGPLFDLFNSLDPAADSMMHNPIFEIGFANWIDAYEVENDVEVDMNVETRGIAGVKTVIVVPTQSHRTLPAGNKIVFSAYDPISLNTAVNGDFPYYNWIGFDNANTPYQVLNWFGIAVGVEKEDNLIPKEFSISQNYPNPFNPSTTIKFSVPQQSNVVLRVYDILGSEVANLVNETLDAGNYTINFDASQFASGMYIYTLTAGDFTTSKKMMLLK